MKETLLQFAEAAGTQGAGAPAVRAKLCPECSHHFSGDARFCPFDGVELSPAPDWDPAKNPLIGSVLDGRYEIQSVLGEGGMGTVYRARHQVLERLFAVKVLRRDLSRDAELGERFIQEAKAAAAVSHPNVVQITDFGEIDTGEPYFVMELLEGQPLSKLVAAGGPLPAGLAVHVIRAVAEALGAAHAAGVVHRDLKPDNIHVARTASGDEVVKVLDFGLAKVAGASKLTRKGMVFGTPHYMSPEQASGNPVDRRSDIYALGVVMYEMFTGKVPFEADSYMGVLTKHMYVAPQPLHEVIDATELGALEDLTLRCLEKKPERRFASMAEFVTELDAVIELNAGGAVQVRPSRAGQAPVASLLADALEPPGADEHRLRLAASQSNRLPWAVAGAVVATGIGGVWAASMLRDDPDPPSPAVSAAVGPVQTAATVVAVDLSPAASVVSTQAPPPPSGDAASDERQVTAPTTPRPPVRARAPRRPSPAAPPARKASAPTAAPQPARPKPKIGGGGDIIDPWK